MKYEEIQKASQKTLYKRLLEIEARIYDLEIEKIKDKEYNKLCIEKIWIESKINSKKKKENKK